MGIVGNCAEDEAPFREMSCFTMAHAGAKKFRGAFSELCRNNSSGSMFLSVFPRRRADSRLAFFPAALRAMMYGPI